MSLFKFQEFWNTNCGSNEQFDQNSIHIGNVDNAEDGRDKIVVGSHSGILRVYSVTSDPPSKPTEHFSDLSSLHYADNDLLLETQFQEPILQLCSGMFLSGNSHRQLMVLFPKKISVFSLASNTGVAKFGFFYNLLLIYEHELPKMAFNLVVGNFGHVQGKDFVCVQSLDGCLMFFEQESASFVQPMTNFLLPTSFCYMAQSDAFLIQTGDWALHSFRYQVLAISSTQHEDKNNMNTKRMNSDWSLEVSQPVQQMSYLQNEQSSFVCILCEYTLYIIKESGSILWQKKLDQPILYMHTYWLSHNSTDGFERMPESKMMILLTTDHSCVWVYGQKRLKWACSTPFKAVAASQLRVNDGALRSCLVLLGEQGQLSVGYLGTSPSTELVASLRSTRLRSAHNKDNQLPQTNHMEPLPENKDDFDREMHSLQKIISNAESDFDKLIKIDFKRKQDAEMNTDQLIASEVTIDSIQTSARVVCGKVIHYSNQQSVDTTHWLNRQNDPDKISMFEIHFKLQTKSQFISEVQCNVCCIHSIQAAPDSFIWKTMDANSVSDLITVQVYFRCDQVSYLHQNSIMLVVQYLTEKQETHAISANVSIPNALFCSFSNSFPAESSQQHSFKVKYTSKQSNLDLRQLAMQWVPATDSHPDADVWNNSASKSLQTQSTNRIIIKCISGQVDPIDQDYLDRFQHKLCDIREDFVELQSNQKNHTEDAAKHQYEITVVATSLTASVFIVNQLMDALLRLIDQQSGIRIDLERHFLSFPHYFECVDRHLSTRHQVRMNKQQLEDLCTHYRLINKRLLIKLKERNLTSLNNLDILLEMYYDKILKCSRDIVKLQNDLIRMTGECNQFGTLFYYLAIVCGKCDLKQLNTIKSLFELPLLCNQSEVEGWHEKVEQCLIHVLGEQGRKAVKIMDNNSNELNILGNNNNLKTLIKLFLATAIDDKICNFKLISTEKKATLEEEPENHD